MFASLYELWLGQNDDPTYYDSIFTPVGLITLVAMLALALVFYLILGRWRSAFAGRGTWLVALVVAAIFSFGYAVWFALDATGQPETDSYMQGFGWVNMLYGLLYFVIFSFVLKRFSIYARHTPV